jgi:hypothetical protein
VQFEVTLKNTSASVVKNVFVQIQGGNVTQIWNMTAASNGQYNLPDWQTNNGGLRAGESFTFGFVATGSPKVSVVGGSTPPAPKPAPAPAPKPSPTPAPPSNNLDCANARLQYLSQNPDVKKAGMDPWDHYVRNGKAEGRKWPGPLCETGYAPAREAYLARYPDVKAAGVDAWEHYLSSTVRGSETRLWSGAGRDTPPTPKPAAPPAPQPQAPTAKGAPQASQDIKKQVTEFLQRWPAEQFDGTKYGINPYQNNLQKNKQRLNKVFDDLKLPLEAREFLIAMAMIESTELCVHHRDPLKDDQGGAANHTLFNLNTDMIRDIVSQAELASFGLAKPSKSPLNQDTDDALRKAVDIAWRGVQKWGFDRYTSYVRGGASGFSSSYDYNNDWLKMRVFKCGLSFIWKAIRGEPALLTDNRRVELQIPYV